MTRQSKIIITLIFMGFILLPAYSVLEGGINYTDNIDYTNLNKSELESRANFVYETALNSKTLNDEMTQALNLYNILRNMYPKNMTYSLRLGKLYETLGKDNLAKECYYQSIGTNPKKPEPYFYLGNYFYSKEQYRKALRYYRKAYDAGYSSNFELLKKINDIYIKFGDSGNSAVYYKKPVEDMLKELEMLDDAVLDGGLTPASDRDTLNRELEELEHSNIFIDVRPSEDSTLFEELPELDESTEEIHP